MGELVEISWSSHHENLCEGIWRLLDTKVGRDFQILLKNKTDSEDNHFLDAHFFILQIFCQALGNSNLRQFQFRDEDINSADLRCLLEFMYRGKTQVELKRLNSVKKAAEKLGLNAFVDIVSDKIKDGIFSFEEDVEHYAKEKLGSDERRKSENDFDESGMVVFSYDCVCDVSEEQIAEDLDEEKLRNVESDDSNSSSSLKQTFDGNNSLGSDVLKGDGTGSSKNVRWTLNDSNKSANDLARRKKKVKLNSDHQTFTIRVNKVSSGDESSKSHTELRVCVNRLKCSKCEFRCANRSELKNHLKMKHLISEALASGILNNIIKNNKSFKEEFQCSQCEFRCSIWSELKSHLKAAKHFFHEYKSLKEEFQCSQCEFRCSIRSELKSHLKAKHFFHESSSASATASNIIKINRNLKEELQCTKCEFRCAARTDLKNHLKIRHVLSEAVAAGIVSNLLKNNKSADEEFIKPKVDPESGNFDSNAEKMATETEIPTVAFDQPVLANSDSKELLQCPFCPFKTKHLESHMIGKHQRDLTGNLLEKNAFKCDECDFTCAANFLLTNHKTWNHGEKRYKCDRCAYSSRTKENLEKHVKSIHPSGRRFACEICGSCFKFEKKLLSHKNNHLVKNEHFGSDKRLKCKECEFRCGVWSELKMHWKLKHLLKEEGNSSGIRNISKNGERNVDSEKINT